jgi:putative membrane protein
VHFQGHGWSRPLYFTILGSHTFLALVLWPMVIVTLSRALKERFDRHRAIARWTFPVWLYVSVTGVIVYFMLYQWFAA